MTMVTLVPDTVQIVGVVEVNVTVKPELAVALTGTGVALKVCAAGPTNVIVCAAAATVSVKA